MVSRYDNKVYPDNPFRDDSTYSYFQERRRLATSDLDENPTSNRSNHVDVRSNVASITPDFASRSPISFEEDRQNKCLVNAVKLLLAARDRVLNLSEQRVRSFFYDLFILPTPHDVFPSGSLRCGDHTRSWVLGHNNECTTLPTATELSILPLIVRIGDLRISKGFEYKEAADATLSTAMHMF